MTLAAATLAVTNGAGPGRATLLPILNNFGGMRHSVAGLLDRFHPTLKTLIANDEWT
jgi:hypothetical protein